MTKPPATRISVALFAIALVLPAFTAHSASICRWVDENGRTQISDTVPDKYKNSSTCSDSRQYELSTQEKLEIERREIDTQLRKRRETLAPSSTSATTPTGTTGEVAQPGAKSAKRPTERITDDTDCISRWRIYDESVECFGPYRTTRGATKPEGFDMCNDIPSPELMCGPRTN